MNVEDFLKSKAIEIKEIKYKIIKIKEKEDDVVLFLDNNEKIHVSIEKYFEYGLSKLNGLDQKLYDELRDEERLYLGYVGALRKLSSKDFTVKQINDYLKVRKQLNSDEIKDIVNKLKQYGLLDDDKYCSNRVSYLNKQLLSIKQIKTKLTKEGISKELIDKYVLDNYKDEYDKVVKLANKYSNSIKNKSVNATRQAILNKLVNAGFGYDASRDAVNSLDIKNDLELDLLKKEYTKAYNKYSKKYDSYDLRNHIYSYLINKGFRSEDIKSVMEVCYGKTG